MHAAGVVTVTAALLTAVFTSPASACSCVPSTEGERYQRAAHVFSGVVISEAVEAGDPASPHDDKYRYAVAVHTEYKGDVPRWVNVITSTSGGLCGIRLYPGTEYVVFAHGDSADRRVESHLCSGTRPAASGPPVTTVPTTTTTPPTTPCATAAP
ncbi:hypothetical protein [Saccharothrix deserti]|uniref:hypothetical protein n=1 Tax=Saccharothrix deserti TaxID=2593674 RepID=UPI001EE42D03|nr:hypothetical protein [Saccharothrix deserti]